MIRIQANLGDDMNQNQVDLDSTDILVFSKGYLSLSTGYTGMKKVVNEFTEVDTPYAVYCHLLKGAVVNQINYDGNKLYNALAIYNDNTDQPLALNRFSFRVIFIDNIIDQIKVPRFYSKVPTFFYAHSAIDTIVTPFFYATLDKDIRVNDILEADENKFIVTKVERVVSYNKIYVTPYTTGENIVIDKQKYMIRHYGSIMTDTRYSNALKIMFHDDEISLDKIPAVSMLSDITDTTDRVFETLYQQTSIDQSNYPFLINLDQTEDLAVDMLITDFTLTSNIDTGNYVIYCLTDKLIEFKKGDYLEIVSSVYSEIFKIVNINYDANSIQVERNFTKYAFNANDATIKAYINKIIPFQPIALNDGAVDINYPIVFLLEVKYLNI